jgi:hypothetical protein
VETPVRRWHYRDSGQQDHCRAGRCASWVNAANPPPAYAHGCHQARQTRRQRRRLGISYDFTPGALTLVIYMNTLARNIFRVAMIGLPAGTPVAIISSAWAPSYTRDARWPSCTPPSSWNAFKAPSVIGGDVLQGLTLDQPVQAGASVRKGRAGMGDYLACWRLLSFISAG